MTNDILASDNTSKRAKFMVNKILGEVMEELSSVPPEMVEDQFKRSTAMMYWVATGEVIQNLPMTEGFWDHVGVIEGSVHPALTSGKTDE